VEAFLAGRTGFTAIPDCVAEALEAHHAPGEVDLAAILEADRWARQWTAHRIGGQ
jgi:1-deoxy-D-xylulose 5-phosphate reductoisomerase